MTAHSEPAACDAIDPEGCASEPIHVPGSIQPHGALIVASPSPDAAIVRVSANTAAILGVEPAALLGRSLHDLLSPEDVARVRRACSRPGVASPLYRVRLAGREDAGAFDSIVHTSGELTLLELQPAGDAGEAGAGAVALLARDAIAELREAGDLSTLGRAVTRRIAELTGFDRVMVYRFGPEGDGEVIAEWLAAEEMEAYLGLRYPASDIPAQARELYRRSPLRIIPDVGYAPVSLVSAAIPPTPEPLDLSLAVLRSVSSVHVEYLKNMGVAASMSLSILVGGKLWGLIACHHRTPRVLPFDVLTTGELLAQVVSLQIESQERVAQLAEHARRHGVRAALVDAVAAGEPLVTHLSELHGFLGAGGVAVLEGTELRWAGDVPPEPQMRRLLEWLDVEEREPLVATSRLAEAYPEAQAFIDTGAGLLSMRLSHTQPCYVLWFRPEFVRTVTWAGDPRKVVGRGPDRLHPRRSFEAWQETVRGGSEAWSAADVRAAAELRLALMATALRRAEERVEVEALRRSNESLESFSSIVSHDLREPLAGIKLYKSLLQRMPEIRGVTKVESKIETIGALAQQMENLVTGLMEFARVGNIGLAFRPTDLNAMASEAEELLRVTLEQKNAELRVHGPLPTVLADSVQLKQVLFNLILNAVKYNDKPRKRVEVGQEPAAAYGLGPHLHLLYVRDNGIGIGEHDRDRVFQIFTRVSGNDFGAGSGVGLPIVRKIIERHGGAIWLESEVGQGSTFYFTLPRAQ